VKGAVGNEFGKGAATVFAGGQGRIGKFLDFLGNLAAGFTLILINGHGQQTSFTRDNFLRYLV
jgi:hypothetical protein